MTYSVTQQSGFKPEEKAFDNSQPNDAFAKQARPARQSIDYSKKEWLCPLSVETSPPSCSCS